MYLFWVFLCLVFGYVLSARPQVHLQFNNPHLLQENKESLERDFFAGTNFDRDVQRLKNELEAIARDELGIFAMQEIYDDQEYEPFKSDGKGDIEKLYTALALKLEPYRTILNSTVRTITLYYGLHKKRTMNPRLDCCNLANNDLTYKTIFGCSVSRSTSCDLIPPSLESSAFNPGRNLTHTFDQHYKFFPGIKWQYFISAQNLHTEFPSHNFKVESSPDCSTVYQKRHRDIYVRSVYPKRIHMIIILDKGMMSSQDFALGKEVALNLVESLSEKDLISMFAVSDVIQFPSKGNNCKRMFPVTQEARKTLTKFIDDLNVDEKNKCNHLLALEEAFQIIHNTIDGSFKSSKNLSIVIAYISKGTVSRIEETKYILKNVTAWQARLSYSAVISTYQLNENSMAMFENHFMKNLATHYTIYSDKEFYSKELVRPGQYVVINSQKSVFELVKYFYNVFPVTHETEVQFSLPYVDLDGRGLVISISAPVIFKPYSVNNQVPDEIVGVFGMDLFLAELADVVTYYNKDRSAYAFLLHKDGYTIMHPSLNRPINTREVPMHTDIRHFEKYPGFEAIRTKILYSTNEGNASLLVDFKNSNLSINPILYRDAYERPLYYKAIYHWRRLLNAPFIVVVKTMHENHQEKRLKSNLSPKIHDMNSNRLDLFASEEKPCLYLKQLSTFAHSTFFLSARTFNKPFDFLSEEERKLDLTYLIMFLSDSTGFVTNSRQINPEIRQDLAVVSRINKFWVDRHEKSFIRSNIVRRYVATTSGVVRVFPGSLMHAGYDPTTWEWYMRAMQYPGKVVITAPYLDSGGAGYIVTLSYTIFEGNKNYTHNPDEDRVVAVMAIDLTYKFLYMHLRKLFPICRTRNLRCFIMEDTGYMVAHPGFMQPHLKGPSESNHITHREPLIAHDVLGYGQFVRKILCNSFNDRTVQRMYSLNVTLQGPITNQESGEHCARYLITQVPRSNLFLGVVNETVTPHCGPKTAFCPCSTVDRHCLNCKGVELKVCECPCECSLSMGLCSGRLSSSKDEERPSCPWRPEPGLSTQPLTAAQKAEYPVCPGLPPCRDFRNPSQCAGVVGCEWCEKRIRWKPDDRDSGNQEVVLEDLEQARCELQDLCFGGVLNAKSPYRQVFKNNFNKFDLMEDDSQSQSNSDPKKDQRTGTAHPVGPITGALVCLILSVILVGYCYSACRKRQQRNNGYQAGDQDCGGLVGPMDDDDDKIAREFENNPAAFSPYRVQAVVPYRRNADPSDHGYSTYHGDQEDASTACGGTTTHAGSTVGYGAGSSVVSDPDSAVIMEAPSMTNKQHPLQLDPDMDSDEVMVTDRSPIMTEVSRRGQPPAVTSLQKHQTIPEHTEMIIAAQIHSSPPPELPRDLLA